jgi:tetratricopeptide (TPR) repeat protein
MKAKLFFPLTALVLIAAMFLYFLMNPSYEKSLEAKYYYEVKNYQKAYELANEAFKMDIYNRMASTIMAQSQRSMKYQKYVHNAKQYLQEINAIAAKPTISDSDRAKMRMMSEIMVDSYKKLAPTVITDDALVQEANEYYKNFEKLLEKVNR